MRVDAQKNLKKVAEVVLKEPLATEREIAKKAGVSKGTVGNMLGELGQGGKLDRTKAIVAIEETDLRLVSLAQSKAEEWLDMLNEPKREDVAVANQVARESQKRYSMLSGDATDETGGLNISPDKKEETKSILAKLLS